MLTSVAVPPPARVYWTVKLAPRVIPPEVALMVTVCVELTAVVVMVNFADVCPPDTVTEAGTCATSLLLLASVTVAPEEIGRAHV